MGYIAQIDVQLLIIFAMVYSTNVFIIDNQLLSQYRLNKQ